MSRFVSNNASHVETVKRESKPKKTFTAPAVEVGTLGKVVFKENLGSNNRSLIELYFVADTPTEGLVNLETGNKQYCKNTFWLTEDALKEYKDTEKKKPNYASIIRFLAILADNLDIRAMWDEASGKASSYAEYASVIENFWRGRKFAGLIRGQEKSFINNEGDTVKMIEPSLNIFSVFSRTIAKKAELDALLAEGNEYAAKKEGNNHPYIWKEKVDEAQKPATKTEDEW